MVTCILKGSGASNAYGYAEDLEIKSKLPSGCQLLTHQPMTTASSTRYSVGMNGCLSGIGVSGSVSFTKNALTINDKSSTASANIDTIYDYNHWTFRGSYANNFYSYNESKQLGCWNYLTSSSKYTQKINVCPRFEVWVGTPSLVATPTATYYATSHDIYFTMNN